MNKFYDSKYTRDSGDLVQTVIIIAAMTMVGIFGISLVSEEISEQGSKQADCMANNNSFISSNYNNDCGTAPGEDSGLIIIPGYSDTYPVVPDPVAPDPITPDPAPEPVPDPVVTDDIVSPGDRIIISNDLRNFATLANNYALNNDMRYPGANNGDLGTLGFVASKDSYPTIMPYNFDYCVSAGRRDFIVTVLLDNNQVMYVSSSVPEPVTYTANFPPLGEPRLSPCYNNTPYSASDHAGMSNQFGVIDDEGKVISNKGINGYSNNNWVQWTK